MFVMQAKSSYPYQFYKLRQPMYSHVFWVTLTLLLEPS